MDIPEQEGRTCEVCGNTFVLNLFRLNSTKCRYCEDGIEVPRRLKNSYFGSSNPDKSITEESKSELSKKTTSSTTYENPSEELLTKNNLDGELNITEQIYNNKNNLDDIWDK